MEFAVIEWLKDAGRARSTLAGAVVVIDTLRTVGVFKREDVFTVNGQLIGGRGTALKKTLERYGETRVLLADGVTTRSTYKFEELAEAIYWGQPISGWADTAREEAAIRLASLILAEIDAHFLRQQMTLKVDQRESPVTWIEQLLDSAKDRSQGRVEQHLIGAKLERRLPHQGIGTHPAFAADFQTHRAGDFVIGEIVFHVTAAPAQAVIEKCRENLRRNLKPILVIPRDKIERAKGMAQDDVGSERRISFVAIEDFLATNIIELAGAESSSFFEVLESIIDLYNERILQSETDKSLRIELG